MNKALLSILIGLFLSLDAQATDPNFDTKTGIVFLPRVTVNNKDPYINVELLLSPDNTYKILTATPEKEAKVYAIGDSGPAGGVVFYISDGGIHGLEVAPEDLSVDAEWGCYGEIIDGADGFKVGSGEQNTIDIIAACSSADIAANLARDYVLDGYADWFLPAMDELNLLYYLRNVGGGFTNGNYWSSTEYSHFYAWVQNFGSGGQSIIEKNTILKVRAIRSF